MITLCLIFFSLAHADFIIQHMNNLQSTTSAINPGHTKMLEFNAPNPAYTEADIDGFHTAAYKFFPTCWGLDVHPNRGSSTAPGSWTVMGKRSDDSSNDIQLVKFDSDDPDQFPVLACVELTYTDEQTLVFSDSRYAYGDRTLTWAINKYLVYCTAVVDLPIINVENVEMISPGESIWYGFLDYFQLDTDVLVGFNPGVRQGPYWEHWPIWASRPTQTYLNERGRHLYEFNSQALAPSTPEYPDGLICNYVRRTFLVDREYDPHGEQADYMQCKETIETGDNLSDQ